MPGPKNRNSSSCADELQVAISGRVALPGHELYDESTRVWSGAVRRRPAIVAFCKQSEDVQAAVRAARRHGLPVSVRDGGHDWAGRALRDDGLVIDLTGMRDVTVDPQALVATVAGGARAEDVAAAAGGTGLYMGTAALSARDYVHDAIERADLIISIGHDTVEKPPFLMGPGGPKVLHIGYLPATVEEVYFPHAELIGDVGPTLALLADRIEGKLPRAGALLPLREQILAHTGEQAEESRYPLTPQRIVHDVRQVIPEDGVVCLDTACTRSGSPEITARGSRTLCCSTTHSRRWEPDCPRR
jgi:hypothetical protein